METEKLENETIKLADIVLKVKSAETVEIGVNLLAKGMKEYIEEFAGKSDKGKISDGYHTFEELYDHRNVLFINLCQSIRDWNSERISDDESEGIWKTRFDFEGKYCGDGWFIMGLGMNKGEQITYHLPFKFWDKCKFAKTLDKVPAFDEHNSKDVFERLLKMIR